MDEALPKPLGPDTLRLSLSFLHDAFVHYPPPIAAATATERTAAAHRKRARALVDQLARSRLPAVIRDLRIDHHALSASAASNGGAATLKRTLPYCDLERAIEENKKLSEAQDKLLVHVTEEHRKRELDIKKEARDAQQWRYAVEHHTKRHAKLHQAKLHNLLTSDGLSWSPSKRPRISAEDEDIDKDENKDDTTPNNNTNNTNKNNNNNNNTPNNTHNNTHDNNKHDHFNPFCIPGVVTEPFVEVDSRGAALSLPPVPTHKERTTTVLAKNSPADVTALALPSPITNDQSAKAMAHWHREEQEHEQEQEDSAGVRQQSQQLWHLTHNLLHQRRQQQQQQQRQQQQRQRQQQQQRQLQLQLQRQ
eukprot:TRINITY_DN2773_c0_g1_i10.p1 TRINITY_DN2773_c0_g1~~TRINITY_DN2773_c0_g1_i10.p1  ORF type:complete len:371 (-),score=134.53 TRINITY_DN2773_c0_g1_i10:889-1980(-)